MLIEQIIEFESRVPEPLVVHYIPKTGYFHDKTKIFKGKSSNALFYAKNVEESNVPWFLWLGPSHKNLAPKCNILNVFWTWPEVKGVIFFNWLSNIKNFILSSGSENVRNVIRIALK